MNVPQRHATKLATLVAGDDQPPDPRVTVLAKGLPNLLCLLLDLHGQTCIEHGKKTLDFLDRKLEVLRAKLALYLRLPFGAAQTNTFIQPSLLR